MLDYKSKADGNSGSVTPQCDAQSETVRAQPVVSGSRYRYRMHGQAYDRICGRVYDRICNKKQKAAPDIS